MNTAYRFFVTAPRELADLLAEEIRRLGVDHAALSRSGVYVDGTIEEAYRICLWSRLANRVLLPLAEYDASDGDQLYEGAMAIDWQDHFTSEDTFAVDANVMRSALRHSQFVAQRIKDAVADRFRRSEGRRPSVELERPDIRINAHIDRDRVQLYLDLAGESLHQRGYRGAGGAAPLKENLAAAMLLRAEWPRLAAEGHAFVDFMCGSGTLLIEAAQIALDVAPGLTRERFGFMKWRHHRPELWKPLIDEASQRREHGSARKLSISGYDKDQRAVRLARDNIAAAGLGGLIQVERRELAGFRADIPGPGLVAVNPPYGKRLGAGEDLIPLYTEIGDVLRRRFRHWRAALLTDSADLGKAVGIRARKIHTLYNGALKCSLLHFEIEEANFFAARGAPEPLPPGELSSGASMFRNRLNKNVRRLRAWIRREGVSCYRVYDADLPEYAVAVDLYGNGERFLHLQEYAPPPTVDRNAARRRIREVITVLLDHFQVDREHLFFKRRVRQRGSAQYERLARTGSYHEVVEAGMRLIVNFDEHLDTGLFLDHRITRRLIREESEGRSFLNLFAYTGSMTVAAGAGGASSTTSVDLSPRYLDWARRNLTLNGYDGAAHRFIQADCMQWLEQGQGGIGPFDLIFLDPPTFSNSARMARHFDVQADHERLIELTMACLSPGGKLYFSVNARRFSLAPTIFERFDVVDITRATIPPDFARRPNIHRCWILTRGRG